MSEITSLRSFEITKRNVKSSLAKKSVNKAEIHCWFDLSINFLLNRTYGVVR